MTKLKSHSAYDPHATRDEIIDSLPARALRENEHFAELTAVRIEDGM